MPDENALVPLSQIEGMILTIRGQRVMLDSDLAALYGVETKNLNRAVKRNLERFPPDFMFQLTREEAELLRRQFGTSKAARGGRRYLPFVFTEHDAIMAANVLNSPRAVEASVHVVRAFVKLREVLATHKEMAGKLAELERRLDSHDHDIKTLVTAIRRLMQPPDPSPKRIGFRTEEPEKFGKEPKSEKGKARVKAR